ncbi:MAG: YlbF family regulator [Clostridia bacterium]|nr:YlbF family regulator [Clostridia bacterium]
MTVLEKAAELGAMIRETEEKKRLDSATAAYEADEDMKAMIEKYNEHAKKARDDLRDGKITDAVYALCQQQLSDMSNIIMQRPAMVEYAAAKHDFDELMQKGYGEITYQITGSRPCSHDCGNCSANCAGKN